MHSSTWGPPTLQHAWVHADFVPIQLHYSSNEKFCIKEAIQIANHAA